MKKPVQLHSVMLRLAAVLLVLVLATTSVISGRFARYAATDASEEGAHVAAFVFRVQDAEQQYVDISKIQKPGDSVTYKFTVTNASGTVISEVEEEYWLRLELRGSLPLVCTLNEEVTLQAAQMDNAGAVAGNAAEKTFQAAVKSEQAYTLTVTWPAEENDLVYAQAGLAELVLSLQAQQVD